MRGVISYILATVLTAGSGLWLLPPNIPAQIRTFSTSPSWGYVSCSGSGT